jgi:hypothetical protein
VERCGRGAGAGPGQVRSSPASLSLSLSSLALVFCRCWRWDLLLSSLYCRIHFCSEYHILSQAIEESSAQTNNSLFIKPFIGRDFVLFPFISSSPLLLLLLRFFLRNWVQANRAEHVFFVFIFSIIGSAHSLFIELLIGSDFLLFLYLDSS